MSTAILSRAAGQPPASSTDAAWVVRPARLEDVDAIAALGAMTGGGFLALSADRDAMAARVARSTAALAVDVAAPHDEFYMLVLEDAVTGRIGGTASLQSRIGAAQPHHSFSLRAQGKGTFGGLAGVVLLELSRELEGASEVGGLFLHPALRAFGLGRLLSRSRYLFIAQHRTRFAPRLVAELRGWLDPAGRSPFWDAVGRRFYPVSFRKASELRATQGSAFLASRLPDVPLCANLLSTAARRVLGRPHDSGKPAFQLLVEEGFTEIGSIDLLEGGPNLVAQTDDLRALRDSRAGRLHVGAGHQSPTLACAGSGTRFCAWYGVLAGSDRVALDPRAARRHSLEASEQIRLVAP